MGSAPQATPVTKIIQRLLCVHIMRFKLIHDGVEHRTSSMLGEPLNLGAQGCTDFLPNAANVRAAPSFKSSLMYRCLAARKKDLENCKMII